MSLLIVGLDNTIVNVALPSIGRELHASVSELQWTVDAYTLVLASLLMLGGSMGDRLGRRRVFQTGLALFTLGSLLCSAAPSLGWLIVFRMLQAVGGSMLNPVAMSIIRNVFTDARERAQAIGMWGATIGISLALGPGAGRRARRRRRLARDLLDQHPSRASSAGADDALRPRVARAEAATLDPVGQLLVIVLLASLTYGIIEAPSAGWLSGQTIGLFVLATATLAALVPYEARRAEPLIDPRFFRSVPFSGASAIAVLAFSALGAFLFINTLYLQEVRVPHLSAFTAGLCTLPIAAMTLFFAPLSGRIVGRRGPRLALLVGGLGIGLGGLLLVDISSTTQIAALLPAYFLFGIGFGMVNPPITNTAVLGMPEAQAGVAAAVASTSRQVGQTLGVARRRSDRGCGCSKRRPGLRRLQPHRLVDGRRLRCGDHGARAVQHDQSRERKRQTGVGWPTPSRGRRELLAAPRVAQSLPSVSSAWLLLVALIQRLASKLLRLCAPHSLISSRS